MHIRMTLASDDKAVLLGELASKMQSRGLSVTELARRCNVNQGHVSRIMKGDFKRLSANVMRICMELEIDIGQFARGLRAGDDRGRLATSALSTWNGTREDAELLISLFETIAALRKFHGR